MPGLQPGVDAAAVARGIMVRDCVMQAITKNEFSQIFGPAAMHAVGHIAANLSFAAVAISLTHTVKTLEPAFNVLLSKLFLGVGTPLPVVSTLIPIMVRAATASCHHRLHVCSAVCHGTRAGRARSIHSASSAEVARSPLATARPRVLRCLS